MGIFLVIVLATAFVVHIYHRQPREFRVTRTALLHANSAAVFAYLNDLEKWQTWSPWVKLDPNARRSYSGDVKTGPGATMSWQGRKVGRGIITILDSKPVTHVRLQLEFHRLVKIVNTVEFNLAAERTGTLVTWSVYRPFNFAGKVMNIFMDYDKTFGRLYETGLANLGALLHTTAREAA
jgi:hypothetical protein